MTRIFISHSSRSQRGCELARALADELRLHDHAPRVDFQHLQAGDRWRRVIDAWLGNCEVAIMILDDQAISSPWIAYEAAVLHHRRSRQPERSSGFAFVVYLDGVTPEAVAEIHSFGPIPILEYQLPGGVPVAAGADVADAVNALMGALTPLLAGATQKTPVDWHVKKAATFLRFLNDNDISTDVLDRFAQHLDQLDLDLPEVRDPWANREGDAAATTARQVANWLCAHGLVKADTGGDPEDLTLSNVFLLLLAHARGALGAIAANDPTMFVRSVLSTWIPEDVTSDLLVISGARVTGGTPRLPFGRAIAAELAAHAAWLRTARPGTLPTLFPLSLGFGIEDLDPARLRQLLTEEVARGLGVPTQEVAATLGKLSFPVFVTLAPGALGADDVVAARTGERLDPLNAVCFMLLEGTSATGDVRDVFAIEPSDEFEQEIEMLLVEAAKLLGVTGEEPE